MESRPPACGVLPFFRQVGAHLADELARAVGTGLERVGDLVCRLVADPQLFLIDEGVVDAVDHQLAKQAVLVAVLVLVACDVVIKAESLEEVLVDDIGSGRDDGVDHVVPDQVDDDLLQAGGDQRSGETEDDAAVGIAKHHLVNRGGAGGIARTEGHRLHGIDQSDYVVLLDIDVLDGLGEEFLFRRHSLYRIPSETLRLA
jgi:hypothetical protein